MRLARLTAYLFMMTLSATAGEDLTCRDCQEMREQKPSSAPQMRLQPGCADTAGFAKLSGAELDRYCRWVVRAERTGANRAVRTPSRDDRDVEAALTTLTVVQPPQYLGRHATVLALDGAGKFVVVRLEKREASSVSEAWRITEIAEPAMKKGAAR
jgi:hypothetical protein